MLEPLEQRRLLVLPVSGSIIDLDDSPDVSFITSGNDVVEVILSGGNIQVRNGAGTVIDQRSASGITGISINGQGGNDFIRIGRADGSFMPTVPVTIRGGSGNDTIIGGLQADQLFGDDGNDRLDGRAAGDIMNGGTGFDTADYGYRTRSINVSLQNSGTANDGTNTVNSNTPAFYNDGGADNLVDVEGVIGSANQDFMTGSTAANWFDGGGGNDTVFGGAGIDTIIGGVHTDLAYGENDADFFFMQDSTADQFLGGAGTTSAQYDAALDTAAPPAFAPLASLFSSVAEADGELELDDTFSGGKVVTLLDGSVAQINDVAMQFDEVGEDQFEEKIVVVGSMLSSSSESYDFLIARYNADGTLDETFGPDQSGFVLVDVGVLGEFFTEDVAHSLAIGQDNKIIVVGGSERTTFINDVPFLVSEYAMVRLLEDGELDDDFGTGGLVVGAPDDLTSYDVARRVAIQVVDIGDEIFEERYLVTGELGIELPTTDLDSVDWGTLRLTNDGEYDDSFGGGLVRTDFSEIEFSSDDYATGLAIDPETGNVWVTGYSLLFSEQFVVKGFTADGEEIDGLQSFYDFGFSAIGLDAAISDGRLIVVGQVFQGEAPSGAGVATFSVDPEDQASLLNSTFVTTEEAELLYRSVAVNQDGVIVAAGNWGDDFYLECFDAQTLGIVGTPVILDFGLELDKEESLDTGNAVAIQSDGKIVLAGIADDPYAALARLTIGEPEEPPFVDVELDGPTVQSFLFTFVNENNEEEPIPDFLVNRLKALKPDGTLEISGTDLDDVICVSEEDGIITVSINGELLQFNAADVKRVVVHGLGGNDILCADDEVGVPVEFHGDAGDDVLVGGSQGDQLFGGDGRDILIGGAGPDLLRGGDGEDILIGGTTSYDGSPEQLALLLAEWSAGGRNQNQRFANLNGGGPGNNGNVMLKPGKTVFDDKASDELFGEGDTDWFIGNKKADKFGDLGKSEHLTQL